MTNLTFTGGSVTYERSVKVADYETKKFGVTLSFGVPEGEAALPEDVAAVADAAISLVHAKLGIAKSAPRSAPAAQPETAPETSTAPAPRPRRPPAAKPAVVDVVLSDEDKAKIAGRGISDTPEDRKDPAAIDDGDAPAAAAVEGTDPAAISDDPFAALDPEITDQDLVDAATKKVEKTKNAIAVRQLVGKFGVPNMQSLKQEQRKDFLTQLAAL